MSTKILFLSILFILSAVSIIIYIKVRPHFLDRAELYPILVHNDDFYNTFFPVDLEARHVSSVGEYKEKIKNAVTDFSFLEKMILVMCAYYADRRIKRIREPYFDGEKAVYHVEWRIGCVRGRDYEHGLPHTVGKTIIFTKEMLKEYSWKELIDTLIHEKVHLYQKRYPDDIANYLAHFTATRQRSKADHIRANPDINQTVYTRVYGGGKEEKEGKEGKEGKEKEGKERKEGREKEYKMQYAQHPSNITDTIQQDYRREHPFEEMAISIENRV